MAAAASLLLWEGCSPSTTNGTLQSVVFAGCTAGNGSKLAASFSCAMETSCDPAACVKADCTCSRCFQTDPDTPEVELSCVCSAGGCACAEQHTLTMPAHLTVSGQSAGGSMAIQHLVAYSHTVDGAAIVAGSPYGCGAVPLDQWVCYTGPFGTLDEDRAWRYIRARAASKLIDAPVWLRLKRTPMLLFSGSKDNVVWQDVMRATARQLKALAAPGQVVSVFNTSAAHVWSLDHGVCDCGQCALELGDGVCCDVNNCGYDLSGDLLSRFYGPGLRPRVTPLPRLHWVAQWPFVPAHAARIPTPARMLEWAIVYVASGCEQEPSRCRVHVNYHGCTADDWKQRREWCACASDRAPFWRSRFPAHAHRTPHALALRHDRIYARIPLEQGSAHRPQRVRRGQRPRRRVPAGRGQQCHRHRLLGLV